MPPTILEDQTRLTEAGMINKSREVLLAGGTVYIGEDHREPHGREVCLGILRQRCVQHLCIEFDTEVQEFITPDQLDQIEAGSLGHAPPVRISRVINACDNYGGSVHWVDAQASNSKRSQQSRRQRHTAEQVQIYRRQITMVGRGVLVLIGAAHLKDLASWQALPTLVYDGTTFMHGVYESAVMMWQLS